MQTLKSTSCRGNAQDAFKSKRPAVDRLPRGGSAFRWSQLSDSLFLSVAQSKIDETGLADAASFREVYRGLTVELARRGYSPEDLHYPRPRRQGPRSGNGGEKEVSPVYEGQQAAAGGSASPGEGDPSKKRPRNWSDMSDEQLFEAAQEKVDESGSSDPDAFAERYRGISCELMVRGYSVHDLEFPKIDMKKLVDQVYRERSFGPREGESSSKDAPGKAFSWEDLSDDDFVDRAQGIIDQKGYPDWDSFAGQCKGLRLEIFKRNLAREEFSFPG